MARSFRGPASTSPAPRAPRPQNRRGAPPRPVFPNRWPPIVNDEIISTYDLGQRVRPADRHLPAWQPTQENLPQFEREALVSLIDEHLQIQELKRVEKEQKFTIRRHR